MMNNEVASLMNNEELWCIFFENMILNNIGVADTSIIQYVLIGLTQHTLFVGEGQ